MNHPLYCCCHYLPLVQDLLGRVLLLSGLILVLLDCENSHSDICVLLLLPLPLLHVLLPSWLNWYIVAVTAFLVATGCLFRSGPCLFDIWIPSVTPIWSSSYSAVVVASQLSLFQSHNKINVLLPSLLTQLPLVQDNRDQWVRLASSPTRNGTTALGVVPCSALFRKFTVTSACLLPSWLPQLPLAHIHVQINVLKYTSYRPRCWQFIQYSILK